jgi:hypothetical protein
MALCFTVNRGIYGHVTGAWMRDGPSMFLYSSIPRNIMTYIRQRYISR